MGCRTYQHQCSSLSGSRSSNGLYADVRNSVPTTHNNEGFDGYITSDCDAVANVVAPHKFVHLKPRRYFYISSTLIGVPRTPRPSHSLPRVGSQLPLPLMLTCDIPMTH